MRTLRARYSTSELESHKSETGLVRRLRNATVSDLWHGTQSVLKLSISFSPPSASGTAWSISHGVRRRDMPHFFLICGVMFLVSKAQIAQTPVSRLQTRVRQ